MNLLSITRFRTAPFIFVIALAFSSPLARGSDITWDTPQQIAGISDVSTTGTLIGAANVGDVGVPSTTVNGVLFQSFQTTGGNGTSGNFTTVGGGSGVFQSNTTGASMAAPFSSLPATYQVLLSSYTIPLFSSVTLTMSGLMIGKQYQFQFFSNNSSDSNSYQITATTGMTSVTLASNDNHADGGLGEWATGTFTADAVTQSISFLGDGDGGFLNGFQLRQLGISGVPESGGTLSLLLLVLGALVPLRKTVQRNVWLRR